MSCRRSLALLEVVVGVAIVALLMVILLPALSRARAAAGETVCRSNLRQLALAIVLYARDADGWLVPFNDGYGYYHFYANLLADSVYVPTANWTNEAWGDAADGIWRCSAVNDSQVGWGGGYGVNGGSSDGHLVGWGQSRSLDAIVRPAHLWMIGDAEGHQFDPEHQKTWPFVRCPACFADDSSPSADYQFAAGRHDGAANVAFADAHVSETAYADLADNRGDVFGHYGL
ncbi:MAG: type II secretion system protein [Phycisphaerae bacterium]|nr:type II secretion system protein [Phycisphaerae bacterium]